MSTTTTSRAPNSVRLPSIHELTGNSNSAQLCSPHASSPRSFVDAKGGQAQSQPPVVLPSLSLNTSSVNNESTSTFKIPPIKPMTPSSVALSGSANSTPTAASQGNNTTLSKAISLGSPAIGHYSNQPNSLLPGPGPGSGPEHGIPQASATATTSPTTIPSPTFHHPPPNHYQQPPSQQQQQLPPQPQSLPTSYQSPIEYNGSQFPHQHQHSRSYSAPVPRYITPQHQATAPTPYYSQPHYAVHHHPNNHGLQMNQPYTITEVVPKTANKCHRCGTTETPEWRRGPKGVRTLCNACGLFHAKLVKRKGAAVAAEEVLNNRVTKGKNGRRISTRKSSGSSISGERQRGEMFVPLQNLNLQQQQHYLVAAGAAHFATVPPNHTTSPLQPAPLHSGAGPTAQAYSLHQQQQQQLHHHSQHQQLPPPPPTSSSYIPQGFVTMPPPALPVNSSMHYHHHNQVPPMPLVNH
ncbi:hypothetical protein KGF57_003824 [Candida theae]|uniref:GATA-type domain-containing protein n=1 Tax=Candida theae TaxID=1198502 RepID=A0AAD5BCT5_9ASCO|nr:uncharacterized protein KGF57_003824 [Candida theae]KAI5954800.1 hypothetical protein KGF57_003824 [Candida theae]